MNLWFLQNYNQPTPVETGFNESNDQEENTELIVEAEVIQEEIVHTEVVQGGDIKNSEVVQEEIFPQNISTENVVNAEKILKTEIISYIPAKRKCTICKSFTNFRCEKCHIYYYCSTYCQKIHWPEHRNSCMETVVVNDFVHVIVGLNID